MVKWPPSHGSDGVLRRTARERHARGRILRSTAGSAGKPGDRIRPGRKESRHRAELDEHAGERHPSDHPAPKEPSTKRRVRGRRHRTTRGEPTFAFPGTTAVVGARTAEIHRPRSSWERPARMPIIGRIRDQRWARTDLDQTGDRIDPPASSNPGLIEPGHIERSSADQIPSTTCPAVPGTGRYTRSTRETPQGAPGKSPNAPCAVIPENQLALWYWSTMSAGMRPRSETFSPRLRAHSRIA